MKLSDRHRLEPLLAPSSVALVGASRQPESAGNDMVREIRQGGYAGRVYPVHPRHGEVEGLPCFPSLDALPERPDLAVVALANERLEACFESLARLRIPAAVVFASGHLPGEKAGHALIDRLRHVAAQAGIVVCGVNGMGFYNLDRRLRIFPQHRPRSFAPGGVVFLSQSGSALTSLLWNEQKLRFSLAASVGQELNASVADFMDYALEQPSTRVIALFLETVRDPRGFAGALAKARARSIPVVVLKAGRTAAGAAMALSHTGALAGNDAAYQALFERHGVIRVRTLGEMAATAQLLGHARRAARGALAAILDSGGEREVLVDLAEEVGVPFAAIGPATAQTLAAALDPGLEPVNPLDAWGTGRDYPAVYERCLQALVDDPDSAMGLLVADLSSGFALHENFAAAARQVAGRTNKPVAVLTNHVGTDTQDLALRLVEAGVPVLDGTEQGLLAVRHALHFRDAQAAPAVQMPEAADAAVVRRWRERLSRAGLVDEHESLALLRDFGLETVPARIVESAAEARRDAAALGYPVALKTAMPGIAHKSEVAGVRLDLRDEAALDHAYAELAGRLGPRAIVAPMLRGGVEVALGVARDPQFGPLVMVGAGGIHIEILRDRQLALAPVDSRMARAMIERLAIAPLLRGARGAGALDMEALATAIVRLSRLALDLGDLLAELDVNPVLVRADGCVALDALLVCSAGRPGAGKETA
jgi:acyl-CoA synthetase (NDP forming)